MSSSWWSTGKFYSGGYEQDINNMIKYDVILADFPWNYTGSKTKHAAAGKHYNLMSNEDIMAAPIPDILQKNGIVFLWCPTSAGSISRVCACIQAWELYELGVAFVWNKTRLDGKPMGACGVKPTTVKPTTEIVIAASRKKRRPLPLANEAICQQVYAPRGRHSEKPVQIHERLELMYPNSFKIELFARKQRVGWDCWGDQVSEENANTSDTP